MSDLPVDLQWAMNHSVIEAQSGRDWWWREYVLGVHNGSPITLGFVCDCRFCYALYMDTEILLMRPMVSEVESLLSLFQANRARESSRE
jgi:hypothetical protein